MSWRCIVGLQRRRSRPFEIIMAIEPLFAGDEKRVHSETIVVEEIFDEDKQEWVLACGGKYTIQSAKREINERYREIRERLKVAMGDERVKQETATKGQS